MSNNDDFDNEGHCLLTPEQVQLRLNDRRSLINRVLIPTTPAIFETRDRFHRFTEALSDNLYIHPRNIVIRGSSLLGFSMAPSADKVWVSLHPNSDVDLAIIDTDYYHVIEREIRHIETRSLANAVVLGDDYRKRENRRSHRQFYCYRYFDLPNIPTALNQSEALGKLDINLLDRPRKLEAFIYRDWWSFFGRWDSDLRRLADGVRLGELAPGGPCPRSPLASTE